MPEAIKAAYIKAHSFGLGDLVVCLPAVQSLIKSGLKTTLVTRHQLQRDLASCIPGLAGVIDEGDFHPSELEPGQVCYDLRDHPLQKNYWWGSQEFEKDYPGYTINKILSIICQDLDLAADFENLIALPHERAEEVENKVVFLPGTDGEYKCWPHAYWIELEAVLNKEGIGSVVVGQPQHSNAVDQLVNKGELRWIPTPTMREALDVLSTARAVVGVDTGLMHLAAHQGRPTIALFRHNPIYMRDLSNSRALQAKPCRKECLEQSSVSINNSIIDMSTFTPRTWRCELSDEERCMSTISVDEVIRAMNIESLAIQH